MGRGLTFALEQLPVAMREQAQKKLAAAGTVREVSSGVAKPPPAVRAAKYHARQMRRNGTVFGSQKEYRDYLVLVDRESRGEVRNIRCQVKFSLFDQGGHCRGEHIGTYRADFVFEEKDGATWRRVVADSKSEYTRKLRDWPRTKKLMLACHSVEVREL